MVIGAKDDIACAPGESMPVPDRRPVVLALLALIACILAVLITLPRGIEIGSILANDDPVWIAERGLDETLNPDRVTGEIEAALAANDADLARSFVDLAQDRGISVDPALTEKITTAVTEANSSAHMMEVFARGFITGEPDDVVGLAGTTLGDLFVFGDIRDAVREGSRLASGDQADELVLGLACVGLAITAGTYASFGAGTPARVGVSVAKAARKAGRLSAGMAGWIGRSLREVIDWAALRRAIAGASMSEPALAVRAAREAVKVEKAGGLMQLVRNVGRVQTRAGTQAALDGLKVAENPREMARVAELAEKQGGKTRATLKVLGRGAIALGLATFNLSWWILGAIFALFGFVASCKGAVERATWRHLQKRKLRILQAKLAAAEARV